MEGWDREGVSWWEACTQYKLCLVSLHTAWCTLAALTPWASFSSYVTVLLLDCLCSVFSSAFLLPVEHMIVLWKWQICSFSLVEIVLLSVERPFLLLFSVH